MLSSSGQVVVAFSAVECSDLLIIVVLFNYVLM